VDAKINPVDSKKNDGNIFSFNTDVTYLFNINTDHTVFEAIDDNNIL